MKNERAAIDEKRGSVASERPDEASDSIATKSIRAPNSLLLTQAYEEYFERLEKGELLDPDEFCAQHPHLRSALVNLLHLHSFLEKNEDLTASPAYPKVGEAFLHFTLLHELGKGAFATVFLAEDTLLGRRAVLKLSRRARDEAKIMGQMEHPNVVLIHSIAEDPQSGLTAICMPYRGSATLNDLLVALQAGGQMPESANVILETAQYLPMPLDAGASSGTPNPILRQGSYLDGVRHLGVQIADALAYLHAYGICHGDMKPSNILLTPNGTPMLLDFNLSTDLQGESSVFGGTLPYMAPEVLSAVGTRGPSASALDAGVKADLYAFGVILYQLVTGQHPLGLYSLKMTTPELRDHLLARQKQGVTPACEVHPQVDRSLSDLIQRCLAFDSAERPNNAQAIVAALTPVVPSNAKPRRRRTLLFAGLLFYVLCLGGGGLGYMLLEPAGNRQPADAFEMAKECFRQGDYPETIKQCERALLANPEAPDAIYLAARAKIKYAPTGGKTFYQSAIADLELLNQKTPPTAHGRHHAGIGYCNNQLGLPNDALAQYNQALRSEFQTAEVFNNLGYTLTKLPNIPNALNDARAAFGQAITKNPELSAPYYNRGVLSMNDALRLSTAHATRKKGGLAQKGQLPAHAAFREPIFKGIKDFQDAIKNREDSAILYFNAAILCALATEFDPIWEKQALRHLEAAIKRGQEMKSLQHTAFDSIRPAIEAANLTQFVVPGAKVTQPIRLLDPLQD